MKKNYTVMFIFFMVASITSGLALTSISTNFMLIGVIFATIFLLCAAFVEGKRREKAKT
jgi:hypothetical protein